MLKRLVYASIGVTYGALAASSFDLALGHAAGDGDSGDAAARAWTAWLLVQPFGQEPDDRRQVGAGRDAGGLTCSQILLTQAQYFT